MKQSAPHLPRLDTFDPIELHELSGAELMDRHECKFTLPVTRLPELLDALRGHYRLLTIGGTPRQGYVSRYFDTADFALFHAQHVQRERRHKVRWRQYLSTGASFLEIKRRERGTTNKVRVASGSEIGEQADFLLGHDIDPGSLHPAVDVCCERLTLVRTQPTPERVTLDLNLRLIHYASGREQRFDGVVIIELKAPGALHSTHFARFARQFGLRADRVSKYGVGVTLHYPQVRSNLMRPQLRLLNRTQRLAGAS